jgi:hypothetical protein
VQEEVTVYGVTRVTKVKDTYYNLYHLLVTQENVKLIVFPDQLLWENTTKKVKINVELIT